MHRPYASYTDVELGDQFATAIRLGGRPVLRPGMQLAYADLALECILEEFRHRSFDRAAAALSAREVERNGPEYRRDEPDDVPF